MHNLGLLLLGVTLAHAQKGPCFEFPGGTFLEFKPSNLNISNRVHYSLQFMTRNDSGTLMYSEGPEDYEALFLLNGKLVYFLANPAPSGVEGTSGAFFTSNSQVNNNTWFKVDLWRNWQTQRGRQQNVGLKTGIEIRDSTNNTVESHLDHLNHRGVVLFPSVYIGGVKNSLIHIRASPPPEFVGKIREINEERNGVVFNEGYSLNLDEKVKLCR